MTMPEPSTEIRPARRTDVPLILTLINALADYERLRHVSVATPAAVSQALFGERPVAEALIASCDGEGVGFALFFYNFSTFVGRKGLYLEDLFVRPEFRGRGLGRALLKHLAALAVARDCARVQWQVLDWNRPARDFYESLGAAADPTWINYRIDGEALARLARP